MEIQLATDLDKSLWDSYVHSHPESTLYHLMGWKDVIEYIFGHRTWYLITQSERGSVCGILPLVLMKSTLFGRFMVSLPFFNYGGVLADNPMIEQSLLTEAIAIAKKEKASHIELRHSRLKDLDLKVKTSKVSMVLDLPDNSDTLFNSFKSKLRSHIRKPEKEGLTSVIGESELLHDFYAVFSKNMRDLGTPVYDKRFFATILITFPQAAKMCVVFYRHKPVAAGMLICFKDKIEMPWASSLREYNFLSANMMLYWSALQYAADRGFKQFDFGRSTPHEGTYKFKEQWGAKPLQLYWHYWLPNGSALPELNPHNPRYRYAIKVWQHLPLFITNTLGPKIVKNIP